MKNHRFLWLRNRTTDNRKCEKARNIKEKRTIEMFNEVMRYGVDAVVDTARVLNLLRFEWHKDGGTFRGQGAGGVNAL